MSKGYVLGHLDRDGSFKFVGPAVDLLVLPGDYVLVGLKEEAWTLFLGQVEDSKVRFVLEPHTYGSTQPVSSQPGAGAWVQERSEMVPTGPCEAAGRLLARVEADEGGWTAVLGSDVRRHAGGVTIQHAPDEAVESFVAQACRTKGPTLRVGALLGVSRPVQVRLLPQGLKRPTGLFGQTGAGKSYALGVIVEELILKTKANVVILDPNGDFVRFKDDLRRLNEINDGTNQCSVAQAELDSLRSIHAQKRERIALLSADASVHGARRKFLRLSDLDQREVTAALRLDRAAHPEEYHFLASARDKLATLSGKEGPSYSVDALEKFIRTAGAQSPVAATKRTAERLGRALLNSNLASLSIWGSASGNESTLVSFLTDDKLQAVIVDLSTLTRLERSIVASVVFRTLFGIQEQRRRDQDGKCTVLVLDEAHHLFPQKVVFPEQELTVDWGSRVAGEGRKYGLYLVVASQLPSKVHEHILTQCGNLVLMKMASQSDIDALRDSFSFVTASLLERAKWFHKGEALVIGGIVPVPSCLMHFEGRKTQEGGRDLKVDWGEAGGGSERRLP